VLAALSGGARAISGLSVEGVGGGRVAQIYEVMACSWWVAAWAVMTSCWVVVLGPTLPRLSSAEGFGHW
jgi:hypothetical protein